MAEIVLFLIALVLVVVLWPILWRLAVAAVGLSVLLVIVAAVFY
jgi:hypothetical protein